MGTIRLAYRDNDRTPVIYCIKAMAERHYGVQVEVIHIEDERSSATSLNPVYRASPRSIPR